MKRKEKSPYKRFKNHDLILRDHLALDRTILSNERTLLSYARTAFSLFIVGLTFIQFFEIQIITFIGWVFLPLGLFILLYGFFRYIGMKKDIQRVG